MKILDLPTKNNLNKVSFQGYNTNKDRYGNSCYKFNFPANYRDNDVYLEVFSVKENKNGGYDVDKQLSNLNTGKKLKQLSSGGVNVNLKNYGINEKDNFAYCYKIVPKNGGSPFRAVDAGDVKDYSENNGFNKFNIVYQNGTKTNKGGAMLLLIPDTYNPGFVIENSANSDDFGVNKDGTTLDKNILQRAQSSQRNFSNKVGGTIAGIINKIPDLEKVGYTRIVSLPLFTDDSLSSHGYWIKNAMQIAQSTGNANDYATLQRAMFKHNINLVADGAFVNEGLEGIHFKDVLKWGEDSPFYGWFRASNIKDGPLSMGVFSKNHQFIRHKLVNSPYAYKKNKNGDIIPIKNKDYNPHKATYIQIFDKRLATTEQRKDNTKLIRFYDKTNTDDLFEINTHNDTVVNYSFEINPETYNRNIEKLNEYNKTHEQKIALNSARGAMFLSKGDNYKFDEKFESGIETWDANTDITKLNYIMSNSDVKALSHMSNDDRAKAINRLKQNNYQVQDYAIASGKYWTQNTKNIITEYTAKKLSDIPDDTEEAYNLIQKRIKDGDLPKSLDGKIDKKTVDSVLNGEYKLSISDKTTNYKDNLLSGLMNLPLDSIEFGDSIASVLAYPYITNRATGRDTLGKSRYYLYKHDNPQLTNKYRNVYNKTTEMYTGAMANLANGIYSNVNNSLPSGSKLFENDKVTELGQYVLPMFGQDVAKFAIVKALYPNLKCSVKNNGEIVYDYKNMKSLTLSDIGVGGNSPEEISSNLISKINYGIKHISDADKELLQNSLNKRLEGVNPNSFKLAEVLVDKANAGLDWRIDATKDIGDMDSIRNFNTSFTNVWSDLTKFWTKFTSEVLKVNSNSYLAAEMTQIYNVQNDSTLKINGENIAEKYKNGDYASDDLVRKSGITTTANYSTLFSSVIDLFGKDFTDGQFNNSYTQRERKMYDVLLGDGNSYNYMSNMQLKSLLYSYTFAGNHDKPRALHCLALDMGDFFTDFSKTKNIEQQQNAISILKNKPKEEVSNTEVRNFKFSTVSGKAIAMGGCLKGRMDDAINEVAPDDQKAELTERVGKAIANLTAGKFKGKDFAPDAFGTKPFDQTIDAVLQEMEYEKDPIDEKTKKAIYNKTFENTLKPAMSRLEGIMSFLVALPGNPTLFAGDELGLTGYDEKTKNVYLQCRNCLHWEWLDGENQAFFIEKQNKINNIMKLRGAKELEPLNNGAPYPLCLQSANNGSKEVPAILRQSTNGAMVISLFNATGVDPNFYSEIKPETLTLGEINLSTSRMDDSLKDDGIRGGLTPGKVFYNYKNRNEKYIVQEDGKSIKKEDGHDINFSDRNLILYSDPENASNNSSFGHPAFTGRRVLYNPQYNFVTKPYTKNVMPKMGKNLLLIK